METSVAVTAILVGFVSYVIASIIMAIIIKIVIDKFVKGPYDEEVAEETRDNINAWYEK